MGTPVDVPVPRKVKVRAAMKLIYAKGPASGRRLAPEKCWHTPAQAVSSSRYVTKLAKRHRLRVPSQGIPMSTRDENIQEPRFPTPGAAQPRYPQGMATIAAR